MAMDGLIDLREGMIAGARNMIGIGIATAAAGIIVGAVSQTGVGLVLADLVAQQDWSENLDYRGSVGMHPTALSLIFFGVPFLLGALQDAKMEEL